ncbi:MAG: lysophospholipase [Halioglobus sp.]
MSEASMRAESSGEAVQEERLPSGVFYRHWKPLGDCRAAILLAHGLGEHCGRYQYFAEYFMERGFAVIAPDHYGHGESPGHRAHIDSMSDYFGPLDNLRAAIGDWYPTAPCFLVGHSMGGLIAARYLLDNADRFAGAALSAPALAMEEAPSKIALWINALLSKIAPKMGMLQLDASQISRDPDVVKRYIDDPLVHGGKISARLVRTLFKGMDDVAAGHERVHLPIILMHGDADVMTAPSGSIEYHAAIPAPDKELKIYPGLYHEIFNEPEKEAVLNDLSEWFDRQLSKQTTA